MMHKVVTMFAGILFVLGLAGCNTISGIGKDIEKGGEAVQKAANK